jgi:DNA-binding MarR family transcriptional regulator
MGGGWILADCLKSSSLTKEELLFLHLFSLNHLKDSYVVSEELTEKGIQEELDCNLGLVSRILRKNEQEGNIIRMKSKILTKKRRQNVFFLTKSGMKIAQEIIELTNKPEFNNNQNKL